MTILSETTAFARSLLSRPLLRFGMVGSSATTPTRNTVRRRFCPVARQSA